MSRIVLLDGLVYADPNHRGGIPCIEGSRYSVADVLGYLAGTMSRTEICDLAGVSETDLREIVRWAGQVTNDNGVPKPAHITGVLRRRGQTLADVWRKMGQQPHTHPHYKVTQRLADVAPDLVTAIEQIAVYV